MRYDPLSYAGGISDTPGPRRSRGAVLRKETAVVEVACVLDAKALLGEGPVWDVAEAALYWVDIKRQEVHRFDPRSGRDQTWRVPEDVGSLAVRERGGLILAMRSGFYFFDPATGALESVAKPEADRPDNRLNDGKPDRQGRFWAGSMNEKDYGPTGGLYRIDGDRACTRVLDGIAVSNTLAWSPDSRTMYHADSVPRTVWAWDFDLSEGRIANRRVFLQLADTDGVPDGATVDAEGYLWVAVWNGWRVARYDPKGRLDRAIELPVQRPTCPAFGGPGLDIMYLTSASIRLRPEALAAQPLAGALLALDVGVKGLPEARFKG